MSNDVGFELIRPTDFEALDRLAKQTVKPRVVKWFWEDSLRINPLISFIKIFMNPENVVIDIGPGHGVASFNRIEDNWRASLFVAMWGPKAFRNPVLWRKIGAVVMEMKNLLVVEAITRQDNTLAN